MSLINPNWSTVGRTDNATLYEVEPRILIVVPDDGCRDDETTAQQSIHRQREHWTQKGEAGAAIIIMDRIAHQTKAARRVYQSQTDTNWITGFALVTESVFGRAVASVFIGLSRPPVPTRLFGDLRSALAWTRALNAKSHAG